jgi:hypothetical protein
MQVSSEWQLFADIPKAQISRRNFPIILDATHYNFMRATTLLFPETLMLGKLSLAVFF